MIHPDYALQRDLKSGFIAAYSTEHLNSLFIKAGEERDFRLEENVVRITDQIINAPVELQGTKIARPWVGTTVVAMISEEGNLMTIFSMAGNYVNYVNTDASNDFLQFRRPAIAKAVTRRLLDINGLQGGIESHWEWLSTDCNYPWHTGDAMTILPDGRKVWIGVSAAEPTVDYRLALLGYLNPPQAVINVLASDPGFMWLQAGRFDTIMAESIGDALSGGTMIGEPSIIKTIANN